MKLTINSIDTGIRRDDEVISFPAKDAQGRVHTIELTRPAQNALLQLILASPPVGNMSKPQRILAPKQTRVLATSENRVGVVLELGPGIALHFVLPKPAAAVLQEQIRTTLEQDVPKQ